MNKIVGFIIAIVIVVIAGVAIAKHGNNNSSSTNTNNANTSQTGTAKTNQTSPQPTGANEVSIINMNFSPASLTVKKGGSIKWINNDNITHTVNESDGQSDGPNSGNINPGGSYSFTFNNAGVFHYHCTLHPEMLGTVTVTQ